MRRWHRSSWSNAKRTTVGGITFASKLESRVYSYLVTNLRPEERLIRQASFPLLGLAPDAQGKVQRFTPDFVVVSVGHPNALLEWTWMEVESVCWKDDGRRVMSCRGTWMRVVEAKGPRKSRDYALRKAAFEAVYGKVWEWNGIGDPPWMGRQ